MSRSTLSPVTHGDLGPMLALVDRLVLLVQCFAPNDLAREAQAIRVEAKRLADANRALPLPFAAKADLEAILAQPDGPPVHINPDGSISA